MHQRLFLFCLFALTAGFSQIQAQQLFAPTPYEQGYYSWPVAAQVGIVANFGELRPNHFHMGMDCRTEQVQNKPVLAAADGYIAKVKIEPFGFGRALYVNHPNGQTTLYAHLNDFFPELEAYVKAKQYSLQTWQLFIDLPQNMFAVKKGQLIAYSGNTGGSQGPHLHFEVRNTESDKVLNSGMMGFAIADTVPPKLYRLAIYDRNISVYDQQPKMYTLLKSSLGYRLAGGDTVVAPSNKISFAITATDSYNGSTNPNGIYSMVQVVNGKENSRFQIDSITYDETRLMNAHIDYRVKADGGVWLQHVAQLPGYEPSIYKTDKNLGVIFLNDSMPTQVSLYVADAKFNISQLNFWVKRPATYQLPKNPPYTHKLIPNQANQVQAANLEILFQSNAIFDTVYGTFKQINPYTFQLHQANIPVQGYFEIKVQLPKPTNTNLISKTILRQQHGNKFDCYTTHYNGTWYASQARNLGTAIFFIDTLAPSVQPLNFANNTSVKTGQSISFKVSDNSDEIKKFTALVNGNWLRFTNDKGRVYTYKVDENFPEGTNTLQLIVEDIAGNKTEKTYTFYR